MPVLVLAPTEQPPESASAHIKDTTTLLSSPAVPRMENNNTTSHMRGDFPLVQLQGDSIPDTIAASLASSLLGHVLFLKNQVPLPIPQLTRLKPTSAKSAKVKEQLLDAYDTLTSHLDTTFTALSTALAKGKGSGSSLAYLAIVLGPSVGTAKARVLLAVDGLETKVWGERDDLPEEEDSGDEDEEDEDSGEEDSDDEDDEHPPSSDSESDSEPEPTTTTHAEHQLALRTADRLLSRALVGADADLAAEMHPTQTHVLIRAPRRFVHPAWVPRQSVSASLDRTFLQRGSAKGKGKVEGVWVACRRSTPHEEEEGKQGEEEDEMIWWSWDGKIVGFAGW